MTIKTWQQLMGLKEINQSKNWAEQIESVVESENLLAPNMTHFMDQNLISWKIYKWFQEHDKGNSFQVRKKSKIEIQHFFQLRYRSENL